MDTETLNTTGNDLKPAKCSGLKKALKICALVAAVTVLLVLLDRLLMPKYISKNEEGALVAEYYKNAGGNDVIFIGDCEVYSNFSPVKMWEEYGITSYVRGSPQQLIWQSYYLLEETFRYEKPEVVVFNVLSMKYGEPQSEAYNRLTLDGMKLSDVKLRAVKASMTEEESLASYIFPLLRFHSRWSELSAEDVKYMFSTEPLSHNGFLMRVDVKAAGRIPTPPPLEDYSFSDTSWEYLEKIRTICENNGVRLVLIKAPTLYPPWYGDWNSQIVEYAAAHGLEYINFLELTDEIGLDYSEDTFDAGLHLNLSGAEKMSVWFGKYLTETDGVKDRRGDAKLAAAWAEKVKFYNETRDRQYAELAETGSLSGYR